MKAPVPVYGPVPPVAATVTFDVPPLHRMGVWFALTTMAGGAVMVTATVALQLPASVTVKLYVPAVLLKVPVPVYGGVPPFAETVTVELPPAQRIGVDEAEALNGEDDAVTISDVPAVQPFASVTVNVCVPLWRWNVPMPTYGGVPPVAATTTEARPVAQDTPVCVAEMPSCDGCVTVTVVVALQLLLSPMVKL